MLSSSCEYELESEVEAQFSRANDCPPHAQMIFGNIATPTPHALLPCTALRRTPLVEQ